MAELHKYNIMHRDLKTDNIMFHQGKVKIIDFGCSKQSLYGDTDLGTRFYQAPEISISTDYNNKCDIYSLGVILFKMIYGTFPFNQLAQVHYDN